MTPLLLGSGKDFVAVLGKQRLVGGDHVLAVVDGLQNQRLGDITTADQFDDDVDLGVTDDGKGSSVTRQVPPVAAAQFEIACRRRYRPESDDRRGG
jgi:hypothetical protein